MKKICFFDSLGTLLDTSALDPLFLSIFGDVDYRKKWYEKTLHTSLVVTLSGRKPSFNTIALDVLSALANVHGVDLNKAQKHRFEDALATLPLYADVRSGLMSLRAQGYTLAILTNAGEKITLQQLENVQAEDLFEAVHSAEDVEYYKPAVQVYNEALDKYDLKSGEAWFVAAHAWDTHGAHYAGLKTALILRPDHGMNDCLATPDITGATLVDVAEKIANADRPFFDRLLHPNT